MKNSELKYGEKEIVEFDIDKDLEIWENKHKKDYTIKVTLPEFMCLCPRSGYPDFATIYIEYRPDKWVVELKAIKLYINSFMTRHISHEDSANEIYDLLESKLKPKYLKVVADFNPRGNVHTIIEIDSDKVSC
jgi:7-cyano-7-deazaguanine reductase